MAAIAFPITVRGKTDNYGNIDYRIPSNSKFAKAVLNLDFSQLPITNIEIYDHCFYTFKTVEYNGSVSELYNKENYLDIVQSMQHLLNRHSGPITVSYCNSGKFKGQYVIMFFGQAESSNKHLIITLEAAK